MEKKIEMKKDFSRIGMVMLIGAILITVLQVAGSTVVAMAAPDLIENYDVVLAATMVPVFVIGYPVIIAMLGKKGMDTLEKHTMSVKDMIVAFMMCYGLLIIGNWIGIGITTVIGLAKGSEVTNPLFNIVQSGNVWLNALYTVILAPVFEEIIFRKIICGKLVKYGQGVAIVTSALIFGLFHGNLSQFFYAFFLGLFLAFIYVKTGNVKYNIVLHMMVNAMGTVVSVLIMQSLDLETSAGMIGMGIYSICIYGIAIAGIVMMIVKRKSLLTVEPGEVIIEKNERFSTIIGNSGMLLYTIFWVVVMIVQALFL